MVYTYNVMLFSLKKKEILVYCATWINLEDMYYKNNPITNIYIVPLHLCEITMVLELIMKTEWSFLEAGGRNDELLNGHIISVCKTK